MKIFTLKANAFTAALLIFFSLSCTSEKNSGEKIYASSLAGNAAPKKLAEEDFSFLVKAYSTGLFRIHLANEASIRSTSPEAIQLASAVKNFYTKLNHDIGEILTAHDVSLPMDISDDEKLVWKELVKEKGWAFDKKFREVFERYHAGDVALFKSAALNTQYKPVNILAIKAQPEMSLHGKLSNVLCEKIETKTLINSEKKSIAKVSAKLKNGIAKS